MPTTGTAAQIDTDFQELGRQAFSRDEMRAPALNGAVMAALEGASHTRAMEIMKAFTRGFDLAADEAIAALMAE